MRKYYTEKLEERLYTLKGELSSLEHDIINIPPSKLVWSYIRDFINDIEYGLISLIDITDDSIAIRFLRLYSFSINYLYYFMGILKSANTKAIPVELINPLNRYLREFIDNGQLLITPLPEINYSFLPLGDIIKEFYDKFLDTANVSRERKLAIPDIFVVSIPEIEKITYYIILL